MSDGGICRQQLSLASGYDALTLCCELYNRIGHSVSLRTITLSSYITSQGRKWTGSLPLSSAFIDVDDHYIT
jgi:hypothetical protein